MQPPAWTLRRYADKMYAELLLALQHLPAGPAERARQAMRDYAEHTEIAARNETVTGGTPNPPNEGKATR